MIQVLRILEPRCLQSMIRLNEKNWKNQIILSGLLFQMVFLLEILIFHDIIIVDPTVHNISAENWMWFIDEWTPPEYWNTHYEIIMTTNGIINTIFQMIFGINIIYIFIKIKEFTLKRRWFVVTVGGIIIFDALISYFIRHYVDFYRLYMYSIYNEMIALYMIYCGRKAKG